MSRGATVSTVYSAGLVAQMNKRKARLKEKTNLGQMCDLTSFTSHTPPHRRQAAGGWSRERGSQAAFFLFFALCGRRLKLTWGRRDKIRMQNKNKAASNVTKCYGVQYNFCPLVVCRCWPDKSSKCERLLLPEPEP